MGPVSQAGEGKITRERGILRSPSRGIRNTRSVRVAFRRIFAAAVAAAAVLAPPQLSLAVGLYIDAVGEFVFLTAPRDRALTGRLARSEGTDPDATQFVLDVTIPFRSFALVEIDIPFIALERKDVERGLGDATVRARARLYHRPQSRLSVVSSLRTGSGTTRVYPFSSQSIDLELGLAYVDTLRYLDWWASASGVAVWRDPEGQPDERGHGDHARFGAGVEVTAAGPVRVGAGATSAFFSGGRSRIVFLATIGYRRSEWLALTLAGQAEGGEESERVGDFALVAAVRVYY